MKRYLFAAALLFAVSSPAAAQDVTPAIDPGLAGTAAANREALDREAARSGGGRSQARSTSARRSKYVARPRAKRYRSLRRAHRRARRGW